MTRPELRAALAPSRRGFTLVELLVALVVGGVVILGGRLMLDGVADDARRVANAAQQIDGEANAERLLRRSVASLETGIDGRGSFDGDAQHAKFSSWCDTPGGWEERCAVDLEITTDNSGAQTGDGTGHLLLLGFPNAKPLQVRARFKQGALRYLVDAGDGGSWVQRWEPGLSTPLAIAAILDVDTLIFRVGAP